MFYNENSMKRCTLRKETPFEKKDNNKDNQSKLAYNHQVPIYAVNFMGVGRVCEEYLD